MTAAASTGQAPPPQPFPLRCAPTRPASAGSTCQARPLPGPSAPGGPSTPGRMPWPRIRPRTRGETRRGPARQLHRQRTAACRQRGQELAKSSVTSVEGLAGGRGEPSPPGWLLSARLRPQPPAPGCPGLPQAPPASPGSCSRGAQGWAACPPPAAQQPLISWRRPAWEGTFLSNTLKSLFLLFFFPAWAAARRTACKWQSSAF